MVGRDPEVGRSGLQGKTDGSRPHVVVMGDVGVVEHWSGLEWFKVSILCSEYIYYTSRTQ